MNASLKDHDLEAPRDTRWITPELAALEAGTPLHQDRILRPLSPRRRYRAARIEAHGRREVMQMNAECLTAALAKRVLGWQAGPDRFLTAKRSWIPRWRFNPLQRIEDAFMLLDHSGSSRYAILKDRDAFSVEVECNGRVGRATDDSKPRAITLALARSLGLEV